MNSQPPRHLGRWGGSSPPGRAGAIGLVSVAYLGSPKKNRKEERIPSRDLSKEPLGPSLAALRHPPLT